ncbi:MAG TPA: MDR family MFS transporter [Acidimicrobiia bacterium]|nr:MDR family MFS transporter [Acidimicrobiia bacterium]
MVRTEPTNRAETRAILVVFVGLMLGNALSSLDGTVVATALPTIVGDLHGLTNLSWVVTAYLLFNVATMPLYGKLGDLYGRKRVLLIAIGIFLAGSAMCGASATMTQLIVFRAVQGIGAGGLNSLPMAAVADLVPARDRARWIGYSGFVFAFSAVLGPLLGGLFTDHLSWRWAFFINLPLGLVAIAIIVRRYHVPERRTRHRVDYPGAALIVVAVTCVVLLCDWGGTREPWESPVIVGLGLCAVALAVVFVVWERRASEPLMPMRLFGESIPRVCLGLNALTGMLFYAGIFFVPAFLQFVNGIRPTDSGLLIIPFMFGAVGGTIVSGRLIDRTGRYRIYPIVGGAASIVGMLLLSRLDQSSSTATVSASAVLVGIGAGFVMQVLILAIQNAVPARDMGVATAVSMMVRTLGGAVIVPVLGTVFNDRLRTLLPKLTPASAHLDLSTLRASPERVRALAPAVRVGVVETFARSLHTVFLVSVPIAVVTFLLAFRLKQIPLREHPDTPLEPPHTAGEELAFTYEGASVAEGVE